MFILSCFRVGLSHAPGLAQSLRVVWQQRRGAGRAPSSLRLRVLDSARALRQLRAPEVAKRRTLAELADWRFAADAAFDRM